MIQFTKLGAAAAISASVLSTVIVPAPAPRSHSSCCCGRAWTEEPIKNTDAPLNMSEKRRGEVVVYVDAVTDVNYLVDTYTGGMSMHVNPDGTPYVTEVH